MVMIGMSGSFDKCVLKKAGVSPSIKHSSNFRSKQLFCFEIGKLRDIFLRKPGVKYLYSPGPWTSSSPRWQPQQNDNNDFNTEHKLFFM